MCGILKSSAMMLPLLLLLPAPLGAVEQVDYVRDIRPILKSRCYDCHGALRSKAALRVDTAALLHEGGKSGEAFIPGESGASLLVKRISAPNDRRMPPSDAGEPLEPQQIALIKAWIDQGAKAPQNEAPPADPRRHWAYLLPQRRRPPHVEGANNPIDAFIAEKHRALGLTRSREAPKHVLLRRVYLDLIGLPPTHKQLQAFLDDASSSAYEDVVDRLLASPQYGERWGRHWMDVWRYSDWSGYQQEIRNSQRHLWRWRDWIVRSLNEDKGYDQMVREMLAGDEIAPTDPNTLRATGYLARSWFKFNRNTWLDGTVEHVAKAFLGMTIDCARCHDHKFDPIDQENYYQLRAFFEAHDVRTDRVPGELDPLKDGLARVVDLHAEAPTYLFARGNDLYPDKDNPLAPEMPEVLGGKLEVHPIELPLEAWYPALSSWSVEEDKSGAERRVAVANDVLNKAREALAGASAHEEKAGAVAEAEENVALATKTLETAKAQHAALLARIAAERAKFGRAPEHEKKRLAEAAGSATQKWKACQADEQRVGALKRVGAAKRALKEGDKKTAEALAKAEKQLATATKQWEDAKAALADPSSEYAPLGKTYPRTSTGRRLALARWITDRKNPLTARVAVNHIWLRHMGAALVDNVFDFGLRSKEPRNAPLLDWLAVELMENDWSMKRIHRLIVTSRTYRMTSASLGGSPQNLRIDQDNHYLWRMNSRPLEAEGVRDSILFVAGNLDLRMGGPDIDHNQGQTSRRRSIYFRHAYEKQMKFLELFDGPSVNECYRRSESVVPQQALAMANSRISLEQSRLLANELWGVVAQKEDADTAFVRLAFQHILSRPAAASDLIACRGFLDQQAQLLAKPARLTRFTGNAPGSVKPSDDSRMRARENLVHVICNHNDFFTIR